MFSRASFQSLATPPKKKAEGDDTEEDVEEVKVIVLTYWQN